MINYWVGQGELVLTPQSRRCSHKFLDHCLTLQPVFAQHMACQSKNMRPEEDQYKPCYAQYYYPQYQGIAAHSPGTMLWVPWFSIISFSSSKQNKTFSNLNKHATYYGIQYFLRMMARWEGSNKIPNTESQPDLLRIRHVSCSANTRTFLLCPGRLFVVSHSV